MEKIPRDIWPAIFLLVIIIVFYVGLIMVAYHLMDFMFFQDSVFIN